MTRESLTLIQGMIVEEEVVLTLHELCKACNVEEVHVHEWVAEGLLEPIGTSPEEWRFKGDALRRAQLAWRLSHDLGINPPGVALALDLLNEIDSLRARLQCAGIA